MNEGGNIKIVVIDDNKELADTIKHFLQMRGFIIMSAYGGKSGLEIVKKEKPDLIILDIMMPDMDGRDVLVNLKRNNETKDIPVVILTAKDEQFDREYGIELGAYEYITKPYDSNALLRQVNSILGKKKTGEL